MNKLFAESHGIKPVAVPSDLNGAAVTGARIKMQESKKLAIVISYGASVGAVVSVAVKQHNAASGGTTKELAVKANYYYKAAADSVFTKVEARPDNAASDTLTFAALAGVAGVVVIEVLDEHLDTNNGFAWVSVNLADSTAAKLASGMMYLLDVSHQPAYDVAY